MYFSFSAPFVSLLSLLSFSLPKTLFFFPHQALQQQVQTKAALDREDAAPTGDYSPWGKGVGTVERDASGKLIKKGE